MPEAKASVRTVPSWRERKAAGGAAGWAIPVRPVQVWTDSSLGFELVQMLGLVLEVVVLVVGLESLQVVSLLGVLLLELNMGMEEVVAMSWRGGMVHSFPFVVLVLLQLERVGSLIVVTMVVFMEVVLVGKMFWIVLTPLLSKWLDTGFTLLVLISVLSRLFTHVLIFSISGGRLEEHLVN
jgi:hypothetical protein